ncbi:hypothetical protein ABLE94_13080 [Gordonia sp. VNK1]|uniref:hypothetical protein n=1 Tax=Gordonia TaxID=2053 RepID=UPI0032B3D054
MATDTPRAVDILLVAALSAPSSVWQFDFVTRGQHVEEDALPDPRRGQHFPCDDLSFKALQRSGECGGGFGGEVIDHGGVVGGHRQFWRLAAGNCVGGHNDHLLCSVGSTELSQV